MMTQGLVKPVPLKIYADCIDGYVGTANERITDALGTTAPEPDPPADLTRGLRRRN